MCIFVKIEYLPEFDSKFKIFIYVFLRISVTKQTVHIHQSFLWRRPLKLKRENDICLWLIFHFYAPLNLDTSTFQKYSFTYTIPEKFSGKLKKIICFTILMTVYFFSNYFLYDFFECLFSFFIKIFGISRDAFNIF